MCDRAYFITNESFKKCNALNNSAASFCLSITMYVALFYLRINLYAKLNLRPRHFIDIVNCKLSFQRFFLYTLSLFISFINYSWWKIVFLHSLTVYFCMKGFGCTGAEAFRLIIRPGHHKFTTRTVITLIRTVDIVPITAA